MRSQRQLHGILAASKELAIELGAACSGSRSQLGEAKAAASKEAREPGLAAAKAEGRTYHRGRKSGFDRSSEPRPVFQTKVLSEPIGSLRLLRLKGNYPRVAEH